MMSDSGLTNRRGKRFSKNLLFFLAAIVLLMSLTGCNSLQDAVEKAKPMIPKGYELVHIEPVSDSSGIVFYMYKDELSTGIFIKNKFGWDWVGSGVGKLVNYPEGLQWRYADIIDKEQNSFSLYYGKVINKDIKKITVTTTNGETVAGKIVPTDQLRLWYAFVKEPQVPSVSADIVGYSQDDKVIYLFSQPKE